MKRVLVPLLALGAFGCAESINRFPIDAGSTVICGTGTTQCGDACVSTNVDDKNCGACGKACGATEGCGGGRCLPKNCSEANCATDQVCANSSVCQQKACVGVTCGANETCTDGRCVTRDCGATTCGAGFVCRNGGCVDVTCAGVTCQGSNVCVNGSCFPPTCPNATCSASQVCVAMTTCTERPCVGISCAMGTVCVAGACKPESCGATPCPMGQACVSGACTDVNCQGVTCPSGRVCVRGACVNPMAMGSPFGDFSSGSTLGASVMSNGTHQNQGVLGDSTPPSEPPSQSNGTHTNLPGQISNLR